MDGTVNGVITRGGSAAKEGEGGGAPSLALLLDELAHGVLVTGPAGQLRHANQAARQELRRAGALALRGATVQAGAADDAPALQAALERAAAGKRSLVTLGTGLTVALVPLGEDATLVAWMFARPSVCDALMLGFFARSHGLTATEEQVLGILCQGYRAPEVAARLRVAVSTVRSHVRSMCAKTRSSGMRELVARVAVLPPVAPAAVPGLMH